MPTLWWLFSKRWQLRASVLSFLFWSISYGAFQTFTGLNIPKQFTFWRTNQLYSASLCNSFLLVKSTHFMVNGINPKLFCTWLCSWSLGLSFCYTDFIINGLSGVVAAKPQRICKVGIILNKQIKRNSLLWYSQVNWSIQIPENRI